MPNAISSGRVVFKELRSHCARRGVDFVGVDLRWGLDANIRGALDACLKEIDRCRPFFVSLLGDRYGWLPPPERIACEVMERARGRTDPRSPDAALLDAYSIDETLETPVYRLRPERDVTQEDIAPLAAFWESAGFEDAGLSITEAEILHGALSGSAAGGYAFFYLRRLDLESTPGFPDALRPVFIEQDQQRRKRARTIETTHPGRAAAGRGGAHLRSTIRRASDRSGCLTLAGVGRGARIPEYRTQRRGAAAR